jgi:hypothetical protein
MMGILERFRTSFSRRPRLLDHLAVSAGRFEKLAADLKHDAEKCAYPNIKAGLEQLATAESAQAQALREMLLGRGSSPRPDDTPAHGSNNWERLSNALALQVALHRELNVEIAEWDAIEPQFADRLREFSIEEEQNIALLRDLTLRCDPQALD